MRFGQLMALAFIDETNKVASAIRVPVNQIQVKEASVFIEDFFEKEAATRAVKEWRKADAAGDTATSGQIAQGYGAAGLKPRYLGDVSLGGAEAGVDRMMGDVRHATGEMPEQPSAPRSALAGRQAFAGRLEQMKANKAEMGMTGATPSHVMQSPATRGMLLGGTQPSQGPGPAPNASGDFARKLYKPDSYISQAEFTPKYLDQKKRMTDAARSLSPEAKQMVPAMYGHATRGDGPTQRSSSFHEFVPGMREMEHGTAETENTVNKVKDTVLNPLALKKNMEMGDVSGMRGTNYGNLVQSASGPKVVDFMPSIQGEQQHDSESFKKYGPSPTPRHSAEGGGSLADLRKEQYKPTMQSRQASPERVLQAIKEHRVAAGQPATPQPDPFAAAHGQQGANPFAQGHTEPAPKTVNQGPVASAPNPYGKTAPVAPARTMNQGPASAAFRQPAAPVGTAPTSALRQPTPARPMATAPTMRPATPAPAMKPMATMPTHPVAPMSGIKPFKLPALGGLHR